MQNNGTCEYVAATKRYLCKCPSDFCGAFCETAKPCKVGSCEYDTATQTNRWKCADDSLPALVFGGIILILIAAIATGTILFLHRRKRKREEEEEAEAAERERLLAEQAQLEEENAGFFAFIG